MSQTIQIPGVGNLQFPDGMSQSDIADAIERNFPQQMQAERAKAAGPHKGSYVSTEDGSTVPIDPSRNPAGFAAEQGGAGQNAVAGYGAETLNIARSLQRAFLPKQRQALPMTPGAPTDGMNPSAPSTIPSQADYDAGNAGDAAASSQLFANSKAAKVGGFAADLVDTSPAAMLGGEAVAPLARMIQGVGLPSKIARAAVMGAGQGAGTGAMAPADDAATRLEHTLLGAGFGSALTGLGSTLFRGVPALYGLGKEALSRSRGLPVSAEDADRAVSDFLQANAKKPLGPLNIPAIPGFKPTAAAATNDLGLYGPQAGLRAKGFGDGFEQQVTDNNDALMTALRKLGPKQSQDQVSAAAASRLGDLNKAAKAPVDAAYAPFDAIKAAVHVPSDTVLAPVDAALGKLNSSERDMLPQPVLDKMFQWKGPVSINEIEGVRGALGDAAAAAGANGRRVIRNLQSALDTGLDDVQSIHNADGTFMAPVEGKAPLQMMKDARAANAVYRQQFPSASPKNAPAQNLIAKAITGKIPPTQLLDRALQTPENLNALLKAGAGAKAAPDPELLQLAQNHYINKVFEASANRAGGLADGQLLNGFAFRDFRAGNGAIEDLLFKNPEQRKLLDAIEQGSIMNNNALRRAMPGESGTNALGNEQDNMADFMREAAVSGLAKMVPGGTAVTKLLGAAAGNGDKAMQLQFRSRLAQALMDPELYQKLRSLPNTPKGQSDAVELLRGYPALMGQNLMLAPALSGQRPQSEQR